MIDTASVAKTDAGTELIARRFPLVARPHLPCPPIDVRIAEVITLARAAGGGDDTAPARTAAAHNKAALIASSHAGHVGHLVVAADDEPSGEEQFLLRALAQQTGAALANQRLHAQEQASATELSLVNERLLGTVGALGRSMEIHARLTAVAVSGEGRDGIARAGRPA